MQICSETKLDSVMTYKEIKAKLRYSLETHESVSGKRELFWLPEERQERGKNM